MASQEMGLEMGMDFEVEEKEERAQRRRFLWIGLVCALLVAALAAFALMRSGGPVG